MILTMQLTCLLIQVLLIRCSLGVTLLTATPMEAFFFSPSYPREYANNLEESWLLTASDPSHVVHLEVVDSQIEASTTCLYDYVQVHDGATTDSPVSGKFCGSSTPAYVTTGRHMYVLFKTDASGTNIGFYIKYYSSPSPTTSTQSSSVTQSTSELSHNVTTTSEQTPRTSSGSTDSRQPGVGQSAMLPTTIIGILVAVAFLLTVIIVIVVVICIHKANKAPVAPKPRPSEEEIWSRINSTPKSGQPAQDSELGGRSPSRGLSSRASGFSSDVIGSPSTINVNYDYHHVYRNVSPVAGQSGNYIYPDGRTGSYKVHSNARRRLSPLPTQHAAARTSGSSNTTVTFVDETADNYRQNLRMSTGRFGLAAALVKARAYRKSRNQIHPKGEEEFERGHKHSKANITRIHLLGYGATSGNWSTGVPKVQNQRRRHSAYEVDVGEVTDGN